LDNAKLEWVQAFFDNYYAPNNAVLTIAGDFEPDQAMELVRKYFGDAPAQKSIPPLDLTPPSEQTSERRESVTDPHAKTPGLFMAWRIPETRTAEHYALELAAMVLADGESSRLYELFVRNKAIARDVGAWTGDHPGPDNLTLMVLLTEKADLDAVEKSAQEQVELLGKRGPSAEELEKAKNRLRASFIFGIQSNMNRAIRLGEYEAMFGDARLLTRDLSGYLSVTPKAVQEAVAKYLTVPRRSVVQVKPTTAEEAR
jgi:predicted Zn-dependent peptidase